MSATQGEDASREGEAQDEPAHDEEAPQRSNAGTPRRRRGSEPPQAAYEEVTLADLLDVLLRRRRLVAATLAIVLLGTVVMTAAATPTYQATATVLPTQETEALLALLQSRSFAQDVAEEAGLVQELGDGSALAAAFAIRDQVTVTRGTGTIGDQDKTIITITASASTAGRALALAGGYLATLDGSRELLEEVTWEKNWQAYYEQADKNRTQATAQLDDLIAGLDYYQVLDEPVEPESAVSPDWRLNLALGTVLGAMLALFLPFLVEGVTNALEERRARRDP